MKHYKNLQIKSQNEQTHLHKTKNEEAKNSTTNNEIVSIKRKTKIKNMKFSIVNTK